MEISSPGVIISGDRIRDTDRLNILSKQRQIWHRGSIPQVFIYILHVTPFRELIIFSRHIKTGCHAIGLKILAKYFMKIEIYKLRLLQFKIQKAFRSH